MLITIKKIIFIGFFILSTPSIAQKITTIKMPSGEDIELRIFPAKGNVLLLGFPCDFDKSKNEESVAKSLSEDGLEVWMPDILSTYMLPKVRSSYAKIKNEDLVRIVQKAIKTGKDIYLIASGAGTQLALRAAAKWHEKYQNSDGLKGLILLFPRLNSAEPIPGVKPKYVSAVGTTKKPIMILEGGRTPNKWGLKHLSMKLSAGGSKVISKVIPDIRGYFFKRKDPNRTEDMVTSELSGLIKVSLFYLQKGILE
ncbi:hypothetical protein [Candidatus Thiodubiliella endoseptemdiera]|uniref:hypothetical protein n=1 Tax=Candidatus Thiodubiliella endoseptemdiera TaxID=2738886 RepID=UPI0034DF8257